MMWKVCLQYSVCEEKRGKIKNVQKNEKEKRKIKLNFLIINIFNRKNSRLSSKCNSLIRSIKHMGKSLFITLLFPSENLFGLHIAGRSFVRKDRPLIAMIRMEDFF